MGKGIEAHIVNPLITGFIEELITAKGNLVSSKPFEITAKPIEEYDGRMVIKAAEKFDVAVFIAATNFYLNASDMQIGRARGALVCYMDIEVADKIFKAAGLQVPYDEDDESMMGLCGSLCQLIADTLRDRLVEAGYAKLEVATPAVYKNTIPEGVEYSKENGEKQEISFYYLKHKALVIDWTMASLPKK